MKKTKPKKGSNGDLSPEYDFSTGVRGKFTKRFAQGTNLVLLAPDVAKMFPDSESVNRVLRACGKLIDALPARRKKTGK